MEDVELYEPGEGSEPDLQRLAKLLFAATSAAVDKDRQETTRLVIDGKPVAVIAPYSEHRGIQLGHGNVQVNRFE
jgi:hypothetical protein